MASAHEVKESRSGMRSGLYGTLQANTLWHVIVDDEEDDPAVYLRDTYVPLGSVHPWESSVVAIEYLRERENAQTNKQWWVTVLYGPPAIIPTIGWVWSYEGSLESEIVHFADTPGPQGTIVRGVPIGPHVYKPWGGPTNPPPPGPAPDGLVYNYYTVDAEGNDLYLAQRGDDLNRRVDPDGIERKRPVGTLIGETTVTYVTEDTMLLAETYLTTLNKNEFKGRAPETVQFVAPQISPRYGLVPGLVANPSGFVFDIRLVFQVNKAGFQPERRTEMFLHDNGTETAIYDRNTNEARVAEYTKYATSNFNELLNLFTFANLDFGGIGA